MRLADLIFPEFAANRAKGLCATCGKKPGEWRDELSIKEFSISGMCQECQDSVFNNKDGSEEE